jgi:hypothetical protein
MRDFTLQAYLSVLNAFKARTLPVYTVLDWLKSAPDRGVVIRHDVDRRPENAVAMARAESQLGVRCTYYFRVVGSAYDKAAMREVVGLGHELGYHYEDLALCRGDMRKALDSFARHLDDLRSVADIRTAAMHGSPLSRHNNLDIWQHASPAQFGLVGEAFRTVDYRGTYYFTDTGRSWGAVSTNLRDRPPGVRESGKPVHSSRELADFVALAEGERFAISAHPERWDSTRTGWLRQAGKDRLINLAKVVAARLR